MKNLIEKLPRWVRGNLTGLSDENDGHERLAWAGIWNPLTTSVSIIKDIFNLKNKKKNKKFVKKWKDFTDQGWGLEFLPAIMNLICSYIDRKTTKHNLWSSQFKQHSDFVFLYQSSIMWTERAPNGTLFQINLQSASIFVLLGKLFPQKTQNGKEEISMALKLCPIIG